MNSGEYPLATRAVMWLGCVEVRPRPGPYEEDLRATDRSDAFPRLFGCVFLLLAALALLAVWGWSRLETYGSPDRPRQLL